MDKICALALGDDGSALFPPRYIKVREMTGDVKTGHHLSVKGTLDFQKVFDFVATYLPPPIIICKRFKEFHKSGATKSVF